MLDKAIQKLEDGRKAVKGQKEAAMAPAVREALESFCRQEPEFAQAVVQGGSLQECMSAVAKGVGTCISDLDAYRKAVQFYFPGALVRFQMIIDLVGEAEEDTQEHSQEKNGGLALSLEDFL